MVSMGCDTEAGGLDGLGGKPEGMRRLHEATPTCLSLRKWQGPGSRYPPTAWAKAGCTSGASQPAPVGAGLGTSGWSWATTRASSLSSFMGLMGSHLSSFRGWFLGSS